MKLEDAQRKADRANLPISNAWLAAFATSSLLQAKSFPNNRPTCDGKANADQTCSAWKGYFLLLHKNIERETRVARGEDSFGTAVTAQALHNVTFDGIPGTRRSIPGLPNDTSLAKDFGTYLDNLASAATHGNKIFQGALSNITTTATTQHAEIKKLLSELKATMPSAGGRNHLGDGGGGGRGRGGGRNANLPATEREKLHRHISQLQAAVKHKWFVGGFCSTHDHGVGPDHDSAQCNCQR